MRALACQRRHRFDDGIDEPSETGSQDNVSRMTRWSWLMLPVLALVYIGTSVAYRSILLARGQSEGDSSR